MTHTYPLTTPSIHSTPRMSTFVGRRDWTFAPTWHTKERLENLSLSLSLISTPTSIVSKSKRTSLLPSSQGKAMDASRTAGIINTRALTS
jgi:hypothetical protein